MYLPVVLNLDLLLLFTTAKLMILLLLKLILLLLLLLLILLLLSNLDNKTSECVSVVTLALTVKERPPPPL